MDNTIVMWPQEAPWVLLVCALGYVLLTIAVYVVCDWFFIGRKCKHRKGHEGSVNYDKTDA